MNRSDLSIVLLSWAGIVWIAYITKPGTGALIALGLLALIILLIPLIDRDV